MYSLKLLKINMIGWNPPWKKFSIDSILVFTVIQNGLIIECKLVIWTYTLYVSNVLRSNRYFKVKLIFVALNLWYGFQGDRISNSSVKWLKFNR